MKNAMSISAFAVALAAGVASANAAQPTSATPNSSTPSYAEPGSNDANTTKSADQMQHVSLRQQLQSQLEKAGYTQVKVMPSSFFVQAKDKKGDPVTMVIGPDSFAEVTDVPMKTPSPTAQQGPSANTQQK